MTAYYEQLLSTFGHADVIGAKYLAELLAMTDDSYLNYKYEQIGYAYGVSAVAVARGIQHYMYLIHNDMAVEELADMLSYKIQEGKKNLNLTELIVLLRRYFKVE